MGILLAWEHRIHPKKCVPTNFRGNEQSKNAEKCRQTIFPQKICRIRARFFSSSGRCGCFEILHFLCSFRDSRSQLFFMGFHQCCPCRPAWRTIGPTRHGAWKCGCPPKPRPKPGPKPRPSRLTRSSWQRSVERSNPWNHFTAESFHAARDVSGQCHLPSQAGWVEVVSCQK